uniref:Uncharacterized protein n=1 Tax=Oryza barthii TaxID=65489 RepID=A0A0D3FHP5_9ORYZ
MAIKIIYLCRHGDWGPKILHGVTKLPLAIGAPSVRLIFYLRSGQSRSRRRLTAKSGCSFCSRVKLVEGKSSLYPPQPFPARPRRGGGGGGARRHLVPQPWEYAVGAAGPPAPPRGRGGTAGMHSFKSAPNTAAPSPTQRASHGSKASSGTEGVGEGSSSSDGASRFLMIDGASNGYSGAGRRVPAGRRRSK